MEWIAYLLSNVSYFQLLISKLQYVDKTKLISERML